MDIQYFRNLNLFTTSKSIAGLKLFSSIFNGHYFAKLWQIKKFKNSQKKLINLIRNYKINNFPEMNKMNERI